MQFKDNQKHDAHGCKISFDTLWGKKGLNNEVDAKGRPVESFHLDIERTKSVLF